ncbi:MAG: HAD family hydrolase [Chthoniobacterales bacterium]
MKPALVLFDLDHTLLNGDTQSEWGRYLADLGMIDFAAYQKRMAEFDVGYRQGKLDVSALLGFQMEILRPYSLQQITAWRSAFVEERIRPLIVKEGWKQLAQHQEAGDEVILITATNEFLTTPIAELLRIKNLIALQEERDEEGKYTGRFLGTPSYREGKITRLQEWLIAQGRSFEDYNGIWFYSDSHNDLPLFLIATHPVAVNPDDTLRDYAQKKKWPIVDFGVG